MNSHRDELSTHLLLMIRFVLVILFHDDRVPHDDRAPVKFVCT